MSLMKINWTPTDRQLRQFAGVGAVALPLLTWMWSGHAVATLFAGGCGALLFAVGWVQPGVVQPLFLALSLVTFPIGMVVSELVMAVVFYLVVAPLGLLMRLVGRDPMERQLQPSQASYWQPRANPTDPERNFRQY